MHTMMTTLETDSVLSSLLPYLPVDAILNLRLVSKKINEQIILSQDTLDRILINVESVQRLKDAINAPSVSWSNFKVSLKEGDKLLKQWSDEFERFLQAYGSTLKVLRSEKCLTLSEVDKILCLTSLEEFTCAGYVYKPECQDNLIPIREDVKLEKLVRLKIEGCSTLGNVLARTPNLKYLCITSGQWVDYEITRKGARNSDYSKDIIRSLYIYVRRRFDRKHILEPDEDKGQSYTSSALDPLLTIDFGTLKTDRLVLSRENLLEFCSLCYPVGVFLENVRSLTLPMASDYLLCDNSVQWILSHKVDEMRWSPSLRACLECVRSIFIESSVKSRYLPTSCRIVKCGLNLCAYSTSFFQLPADRISELSIHSFDSNVSKCEMQQAIRPRMDLLKLTVCDISGVLETTLDFSFFPNLAELRTGRFFIHPKRFWEMCDTLRKLTFLDVAGIRDKHLIGNDNETPPILKLTSLRKLIVRKSTLGDKSMPVFAQLHLHELLLVEQSIAAWKVTRSGLESLMKGPLVKTIRYIEMPKPNPGVDRKGVKVIRSICRFLKKFVWSC